MKGMHRESVLQDIGLHKLSDRRKIHKVILFYKIKNGLVPGYISDLCPIQVGQRSEYMLRSSNDLRVPFVGRSLWAENVSRKQFSLSTSWN